MQNPINESGNPYTPATDSKPESTSVTPTRSDGPLLDPSNAPTHNPYAPTTDTTTARSYGPAPLTPAQPAPVPTQNTRGYGPMTPLTPAQPESMEDRIIARLAAIMGKSVPADVPPEPTDLSPEDTRLVSALAGVHPAGRDVRIVKRESLASGLFYVDYSYTPATGMRQEIHALVYDNGTDTRVFGGF